MNIPRGKCSYCEEDFLNCKCEQFHPTITEDLTVSPEEVRKLLEYFYERAGYISPEYDGKVLEFIRRLENYEKENQNCSPIS